MKSHSDLVLEAQVAQLERFNAVLVAEIANLRSQVERLRAAVASLERQKTDLIISTYVRKTTTSDS